MLPAAKVEHFDPKLRSELDRLRSKVTKLWGAPQLDERALSEVYAQILLIVKAVGDKDGDVALAERRESRISLPGGRRGLRHVVVPNTSDKRVRTPATRAKFGYVSLPTHG
jgi:hypothetical protein